MRRCATTYGCSAVSSARRSRQEGEQVFAVIEGLRQTALRFHRDAEEAARHELQTIIGQLPDDQAIRIIRAFGYFSHLANIAEDQHHIRRSRAYAMANAEPREGTMANALVRARDARLSREALQAFLLSALCSPVLTAHPTEIRRQSSIERELEIARLLDERDRVRFTPEELTANREALRRAVLTLWQTSILRGTRLKILDEVANGLAYYDHTFLRELPRFYADLEDELGKIDPDWAGVAVPSFLRIGSWIGGDRDGNPFVTADVLRKRFASKASAHSASISRKCIAWAANCRSTAGWCRSRTRYGDWPSARPIARRSVRTSLIGAPSPASTRVWPQPPGRSTGSSRPGPRSARRRLTRAPASCSRISTFVSHSLTASGSSSLAQGPLRRLRRAVDAFGFHLAPIDLRQNSDVHERVIGALLSAVQSNPDYRALDEERPRRAAAGGDRLAPPARLTASLLSRGDHGRARHPARGGRRASPIRQGQRSRITSSPRRTASPTFSKSRSC